MVAGLFGDAGCDGGPAMWWRSGSGVVWQELEVVACEVLVRMPEGNEMEEGEENRLHGRVFSNSA